MHCNFSALVTSTKALTSTTFNDDDDDNDDTVSSSSQFLNDRSSDTTESTEIIDDLEQIETHTKKCEELDKFEVYGNPDNCEEYFLSCIRPIPEIASESSDTQRSLTVFF